MTTIRGKDYKIEWNGEQFLVEMDKKFKREVEKKAAKNIEKRAKQLCPTGSIRREVYQKGKYRGRQWTGREPGRLKKSIKAYKSKFKDGGWIVMAGGFLPFYAYLAERVELGGPKQTPKPYLTPALELERQKLFNHITNAAKKVRYLKTR